MAACPNAQMSTLLTHSSNCSTVFLRSIYDKTCPRCNKISIVIQLQRKTTTNGASLMESMSARNTARNIANQYGLRPAELLDRLYVSKTNQIVVQAKPKPKRNRTRMEVGDDEI